MNQGLIDSMTGANNRQRDLEKRIELLEKIVFSMPKYSLKHRKCKNGHTSYEYAWDNEKCHCGEPMKEVKVKKSLIGIRTPTKNRI